MKVGVDTGGAVLLGDNVVCDAHADRNYRVVTHIHADHLRGLRKSISSCDGVIMTSATKDILSILKGPLINKDTFTLEYGESLNLNNEVITFYDAGHIIGSTQVLVEDEQGLRLAYTGDFRLPNAEVIPADGLVIEATYGNPSHNRPVREEIEGELVSLVKECLEDGNPVDIYGYHGKIQEALAILRNSGITVPAIMPNKIHTITQVTERHGMKVGKYFASDEDEGIEIMQNSGEYISLHHFNTKRTFDNTNIKILLSGWHFNSSMIRRNSGEFIIPLSSHSDFDGLIKYVKQSDPRVVITYIYRIQNAGFLSKEITKRLLIPAFPRQF